MIPFPETVRNISESIRLTADGFCFHMPDGSSEILSAAPFTAMPLEGLDDEAVQIAGASVFPQFTQFVADAVTDAGLAVVHAGKGRSVASVLLETLAESESAQLVAFRTASGTCCVAAGGGMKPYLNSTVISGVFEPLYLIVKVWKMMPRTRDSRIMLLGFDSQADAQMIKNLRLMTGDTAVCEL